MRSKHHMQKIIFSLFLFFLASCSNEQPIQSGSYVFKHKYAEHPGLESISFDVEIDGLKVTVTWLIVHNKSDEQAEEVGGCTDGPTVIDLEKKIYWTC